MVSKTLALNGARWCQRYWKPGVSSKKTLGKVSKNLSRNSSRSSKGTCSPRPKPKRCPLPSKACEDPKKDESSLGRQKGQAELSPCDPDCLKGKPNLPPRGCLPWEKGAELCPTKDAIRKLESATCEHLCEPYVGLGFIDKFKMSVCEFRRFEKCVMLKKDPKKCLEVGPTLGLSRKEYPMAHAIKKKYLPGCPTTSHRFVMPKKDPQC